MIRIFVYYHVILFKSIKYHSVLQSASFGFEQDWLIHSPPNPPQNIRLPMRGFPLKRKLGGRNRLRLGFADGSHYAVHLFRDDP